MLILYGHCCEYILREERNVFADIVNLGHMDET